MMSYMMPGMFLFMSLFVPSGLTLYWLVNTLLGMLHQTYINRRYPPPPAVAMAVARTGARS
jgi:membrane protein insertase Oxa1/YidC/SpoIIIJ